MLRIFATLLATSLLCLGQTGVTNIEVTGAVQQQAVKRMGINLGDQTYFDSGQMLKNLVFRNPGFEGRTYQHIIHCLAGSATTCTDENNGTPWTADLWAGATGEVFTGAAAGRTFTVVSSTAPDPNDGGAGSILTFTPALPPLKQGDYLIVRKFFPGEADQGWWLNVEGGATVTTEFTDLPANTQGTQCLRVEASGAGQNVIVSSFFDSLDGRSFVQLNGEYRVSFMAKSVGSPKTIDLLVARGGASSTLFLSTNVALNTQWTPYTFYFTASEDGSAVGTMQLQFNISGATVLVDDVELVPTTSAAGNKTVFRDAVVSTLKDYSPGILRYMASGNGLGDTLDNMIAPPFARRRPAYSAWSVEQEDVPYGLHEFLELCEAVNAEPWYVVPLTFSTDEMKNLIDYLAGPASTPYGARRAARGRAAPWTESFSKIHLELGNEAWNTIFRGATMEASLDYGRRGSDIFAAARSVPSFASGAFDLILGGQASWPARNQEILSTSSQHDSLAVAPYLLSTVDQFFTFEDLFGPLFAEFQALTATGEMRQNANVAAAASRPAELAVYEVNLHTTSGEISEGALGLLTPSQGAGIAVANHMLLMLRELGVRNQCMFNLPEYQFFRGDGKAVKLWGTVIDMGVTDLRRPQFLAVKLANEAIRGDMLRTVHTGTDPTWDQPLVNEIEFAGAHYLMSFAFREGGLRSVVVFNLHRSAELPITLSGEQGPQGPVVRRLLSAGSIIANNEESSEVMITTENLDGLDPGEELLLPPYSMTVLTWQTGERFSSNYSGWKAGTSRIESKAQQVLDCEVPGANPQ